MYSSEPSSVAPTTSEHPSFEAKRKCGHEYKVSTCLHLLVKDVHNLPKGLRIIVNFDKHHASIGEMARLLVGVCGQIGH
ncbi:hypothetical protein Ahy_A03g013685 [Arachis hypogaea]|uniref:Uncharacterized protein n=1 Tax=Arachis hypogaea TaxID=3818 RepID=A0A445DW11_ARAHY|nr:hypothetical protein Ahy_A03g013685 [Arachis hypogaea]